VSLALDEWGAPGALRIVCLHGVRNHGRHFAPLAAELPEYHVVALDLLGHGDSPWEPPWDIGAHLDAIVETVGVRESVLLGHSFGGRLAFELAARAPSLVPKLVLLDPAILLPGHVALAAAENARTDKSYVSFDELVDRRLDERGRPYPLPLLPVGRRRRVRRDGVAAALVRGRARADAPGAR
jgi:lipase